MCRLLSRRSVVSAHTCNSLGLPMSMPKTEVVFTLVYSSTCEMLFLGEDDNQERAACLESNRVLEPANEQRSREGHGHGVCIRSQFKSFDPVLRSASLIPLSPASQSAVYHLYSTDAKHQPRHSCTVCEGSVCMRTLYRVGKSHLQPIMRCSNSTIMHLRIGRISHRKLSVCMVELELMLLLFGRAKREML